MLLILLLMFASTISTAADRTVDLSSLTSLSEAVVRGEVLDVASGGGTFETRICVLAFLKGF